MNTHTEKKQVNKNQSANNAVAQKQSHGTATFEFVDNRPEAVAQLRGFQDMADNSSQANQAVQLQTMANHHSEQQQSPVQRQPSKSGEIAQAMGQQHGVDTSALTFKHNSSFPASVGAAATIQGKEIHFGPGHDSTKNIKHEVGHAIDNAINGTPKGDTVVNGQKVDATREAAADRMMNTPLQLRSMTHKVNGDDRLGKEASVTGAKALKNNNTYSATKNKNIQRQMLKPLPSNIVQRVEPPDPNNGLQTRGKHNWRKMRSKVVGNTKRTTEDVDKAKVALEMMEKGEEQIKKGVQTDNQQLVTEGKDLKLKALSIAHFSQRTTAIKRLVGDNWEEKGAFSEETDEKGNRKVKMRDKVGANGEKVLNDKGEIVQEKVESRHQLTTAQKQGLGQEYEFAKKGMRSDIEGIYEVYARAHLLQFDQTHTFIPEWAFGQIINVWKNWGRGTNFVAPLKNADILLDKAIAEDGITTLEIGLGIQEGAWASANNSIYRFIVKEPAKFDLRLPKGMEGGAYQNEWVHGGKTLGGEAEAVINAMSLEDLQKNVANGAIEIKRVTFFGGGKADQSTVTSL